MAQRTGFLYIDHRASPGIPEEMAQAVGLDPKFFCEGGVFEADTLTCAHCKGVQIKNPDRTRERGSCQKCSGKYLCDGCWASTRDPDYVHVQYEQARDTTLELGARYGTFSMGSNPRLLGIT